MLVGMVISIVKRRAPCNRHDDIFVGYQIIQTWHLCFEHDRYLRFTPPLRMPGERSPGIGSAPPRAHPEGLDDVNVIKIILLREEYIARVHDFTRRSNFRRNQVAFNGLIGLLDLLRTVTIDVVEAIGRWRETKALPRPFSWNGMNYLVKIPVDTDFLDVHEVNNGFVGCPRVG